ncbi:hypothetical protein ACE6H2_022260 [Prunus campanulata]
MAPNAPVHSPKRKVIASLLYQNYYRNPHFAEREKKKQPCHNNMKKKRNYMNKNMNSNSNMNMNAKRNVEVNQFHVLADNDGHEIRGRSGMLGLGFGDQIWDDDDCKVVVNPKLEDGKEQKPNSSPIPNRISQNRLEEGHGECMSWGFEGWLQIG